MDNKAQHTGIKELNLNDVPTVTDKMKYFDGDLYFADYITSPINFKGVLRINFMALLFCLEGEINISVNNENIHLEKHDMLFVNNGSFVEYISSSDNVSCKACAIKTELTFSLINKSLVDTVMQLFESPVIRLTHEEIDLLIKYYELADFKMTHPQFASKETLASIMRSFTIDLLTFIDRHTPDDDQDNILRQGDKLYRRFLFMVTSNVDGHCSVKNYAEKLCVSPKYLASVCRKHGNTSASDIITASLVSRVQNMLLYSDLTIKEIATQLNFDNLSFFGKFVKKHLGHSPLNYRKANNYGV